MKRFVTAVVSQAPDNHTGAGFTQLAAQGLRRDA